MKKRCFFLMIHFLIIEHYELSQSTSYHLNVPFDSGIRQNFILIHLFFYVILSLMMLCVRFLVDLMIPLSTHQVTKILTCRNKLRQLLNCYSILKIKFVGKHSHFSYLLVGFEMSRFGNQDDLFKLKHQKLSSRISLRKFVLNI